MAGGRILTFSRVWYNPIMATRSRSAAQAAPERWYRGADVPMRLIRRFARKVAERFHPDKIILFGSHAYGRPHADSDVDILGSCPHGTRSIRHSRFGARCRHSSRWI